MRSQFAFPEGHRVETVVDTGLEYRPGTPVQVNVVRRPLSVTVSDEGTAMRLAGVAGRWREVGSRLERELDVNISRIGVVSLPVVPAGPGETAIVERIGRASLSFYQDLLEIE
jgi:hypothetical protein